MTAETFFANFAHLADAPNGVKKLRELILQLAVQGKLVPQDPSDKPASVLIERIEAEKENLFKAKILKKGQLGPIVADDVTCRLPSTWEWVRFGGIAQHNAGKTLDRGRNTGQLRDYITTSNLYWGHFDLHNVRKMPIEDTELERCTAKKGDLLIVEGGEAGRAAVWNKDYEVCFQNHVHRARFYCGIDPFYIYRFFEKLNLSGEIEQYRKGVGISNMSGKALASIAIPLPPLEEQKRIVAKVDQLMALCDELEARRQKQQKGRVRLNNAAIDALLTAREPDEFAGHWQRIRTNFDLLYDHPETIAKLRAAILQLAVQGKLVPQDPNDEPASVLLERIRAEKERLVKEGKIKKGKTLPLVDTKDFMSVLPNGWEVCRFGDLVLEFQNGLSKRGASEGDPVPVLRLADIKNGCLSEDDLRVIPLTPKEIEKYAIEKGDILLIRVNGSADLVGKFIPCLVSREWAYCDHLIRIRTPREFVSQKYLCILASSAEARFHIVGKTITTAGQKTINQTGVATLTVSLPPLEEQKRIVAKVDQLMSLCDELESKLNQTQQHSEKLMEATVRKLLGIESPVSTGQATAAPENSEIPPIGSRHAVSQTDETTHRGEKQGTATRPTAATHPGEDGILQAILNQMQPCADYSRADLLAATGISPAEWTLAIRQLKEQGQVVQTGEKRGARYQITNTQ